MREIQGQIWAGKITHELEDRTIEIIKSEKQKEKHLKKCEQSLRDLWHTIKQTTIWNAGVPEEEERKGQWSYLEK